MSSGKTYTVIHKKSNVIVNGEPKTPTPQQIQYGEIAVNFGASGETLSIKNSNNQIVKFSNDAKIESMIDSKLSSSMTQVNEALSGISEVFTEVIEDNEQVIASALVDLDNRLNEIVIPQSLSELYNDAGFVTSAETAHTHTASEVGAMATSERNNYLTTATTIPTESSIENSGFTKNALTGFTETDPTVPAWAKAENKPTYTASEVGAMATSERSNYATTAHTHSEYASSAHTHTAAEVGAMATSERSNYLTTATTIPTESSIENSGFTKNALTGFTETDPTVPAWAKAENKPTYTASEVGAMATSERSNYATTAHTHSEYASSAHTHTASDVGAMATSERENYSTTGHTHDYLPLTGGEVSNHVKVRESSGTTKNNYVNVNFDSIEFRSGTTGNRKVAIYPFWKDVIDDGYQLYLPNKTGTIAITSDIPTEASLTSSGFTKNALTGFTETDPTVPAWAKAENKPTYTASEVGAMATSERSNYATTAHTHSEYLTTATTIPTEATISGSGFTKNAVTGINVNGTAATVSNGVASINVQGLPAVTASDNGKVLMVVDGSWALVTPTSVYSGNSTPQSSLGNDGDIYLQTE